MGRQLAPGSGDRFVRKDPYAPRGESAASLRAS